jgi:hypothetical protein
MLPTKFRFIWPSSFRGEDLKKSTNQKQELPVVAMFVNGSRQNVQSLERTFYRCFLPSFGSFGWGVSEEKIKMWKVNGRRTPSDGKSSHCLWQGELKMIELKIYMSSLWMMSYNADIFFYTDQKSKMGTTTELSFYKWILFLETTNKIEPKLYMNDHWMVSCKVIWLSNLSILSITW